jgi:N,N'-diacetylbacillosaminyl-diphospho-undecaprenol alpha-1,3-N-acetylgalactosaminyltransferase
MRIGFLSHLDMNLYLFRLPVMKALADQGHEVFAICPKGSYFEQLGNHSITAVSYEISRGSLNPLKELATIRHLYQTLEPLQLDILHNFTVKPNIYGSFAGSRADIPIIINSVTGLGSFYLQNDLKTRCVRFVIEQLYKVVNRRAKAVLFQNRDDRDYFTDQQLVDAPKTVIIPGSGIDTERFSPRDKLLHEADQLRSSLYLNKKTVVLMVARAIWDKGVREFYEAAAALSNETIAFVYVGDTDPGNPTCADESFLKNSDVLWLGHRNDIPALTAMADIYVLPSYREGMPRTLLEAASLGKPIVTTDTVGCKEVVEDGLNGFLVPVKDAKALAKRIKQLSNDANLRQIFGDQSRQRALNIFDVRIIVKQYLALYEQLANPVT